MFKSALFAQLVLAKSLLSRYRGYMPARNLSRIDEEGIYCHIYNKGIDQRVIFNDEEDYRVFLEYLKDYLTPPKDAKSIKKDFKVRGRTFQGTPHQTKNYFNAVELIAYSLLPSHFHLLLHQKTRGSVENFIRSLCTRYSIYFNKKYQRTGPLFEGPYKSVTVEIGLRLSHLSRYLHLDSDYSSYPEYLGVRKTEWIKPNVILDLFSDKNDKNTYKDFVEKDQPDQHLLLESTTLDNPSDHLKRRHLASSKELHPQDFTSHLRLPEFLATSLVIFLLLVGHGIRNIQASAPAVLAQTQEARPEATPIQIKPHVTETTSSVEATSAARPEARPEPRSKKTLTVRIDDGGTNVNIRQKPTTNSEKIGKAEDGDTFEFISQDAEWYEVKLASGAAGFISDKYVVIEETNK